MNRQEAVAIMPRRQRCAIYPVLFMALTVSMLCELRTWLGLATFASLFWVGRDRR